MERERVISISFLEIKSGTRDRERVHTPVRSFCLRKGKSNPPFSPLKIRGEGGL